jgi:hypothetical protein
LASQQHQSEQPPVVGPTPPAASAGASADADVKSSATPLPALDVEVCREDGLEALLTSANADAEPIRELILHEKCRCDTKLLGEVLISRRVLSFRSEVPCEVVLPAGRSASELLVTSAEVCGRDWSAALSFAALTSLSVQLGEDPSQLPALLTALNSVSAPALESLVIDDLPADECLTAPLIRAVTRRAARLTALTLTWYASGTSLPPP